MNDAEVRIMLPGGLELLLDLDSLGYVANKRLTLHSEGYVRIGRQYLHRLIMGAKAGELVDHINSNRLDCRRANMRLAYKSQNGSNRGKAAHNTSGYKGVYFCRQTGRWRAELRVLGRGIKLGRFPTPEDAARAYDAAAREIHGEFAHLNFPEDAAHA